MKVYIVERVDMGVEKVFRRYDKALAYKSKDASGWELLIIEKEVE
jgi:hypothetical protein